jgi:hypothetical protein
MRPTYPTDRIRPLFVLRDAGILFGLTFIGGVIIGIAYGITGHKSAPLAAIGISNFFFMIVGFTIAGSLTVDGRWKHLWFVALVCWLGSLVNVLFFGISVAHWSLAGCAIVIAMGIGGGVAALFFKNKPNQSPELTLSSGTPPAGQESRPR